MSVVSQLLSNFKPFSGDGDLDTFLKKYDTICVMQQWDDPTKARNLGLFLEGRAWQVYDDLSEEEKKNYLGESLESYAAALKRDIKKVLPSNVDPKTPSSSTPLVKEEIAAVGHRNSKKQGRQSSSSRQNGDPSSRYANYVCHECKQRGHIRRFCPLRKNKQQPKSGNADKGQGKSALPREL
ncbi:hypothetical protein FOZ61_001352 [Perkinsus olseni]|uniref:CCHC-type domain-containing protein n=1 Tax=Perkinsus olseni TaxID=32597 RepID=A0A7J6KPZ9_PEROL|nr:hypothetical protein FOZ61_001352 [Perkinsus olseni]